VTAHDLPDEPPFDPDYDAPPPRVSPAAGPDIRDDPDPDRLTLDDAPVPRSHAAEQALLGAIMNNPDKATYAATLLDGTDFDDPHHETVWDAIHAVTATGALAEPTLVLDHLTRNRQLPKIGGATYLFDLVQAGFYGQLDEYARIVRDTARLRQALKAATQIRNAVAQARPDHVDAALGKAVTDLDDAYGRHTAKQHVRLYHVETIDELLAGDAEDTYDWVIPDLLERQERVILTAEEGAGKSTLLRQIAIQAAAGIHPFTDAPITPITVLHIDVENTRRQSRRRYRPLRIQAGAKLDSNRLRIELRTAGIDLTTDTDREWLIDTARFVKPDLLLIGPIYKLANGDPTEEKSAKPVAMAIDLVREQTDCAVILEAHAAKAPTGQKKRPHEPYGWSGWLRWPEVGIWLDKDGTVTPWRGAREERSWPHLLERGGTWPWSAGVNEYASRWELIRAAREREDGPMSYLQLSSATGLAKTTISGVIGRNAPYAHLWHELNNAGIPTLLEDQ
jgi:hypothetical protein